MARKLDSYSVEADVKPFDLELSDGRVLSIEPPSTDTLVLIGETPLQDNRRILELLLGKHFDELWPHLATMQAAATMALVQDISKHFRIYAYQTLPGGSRALPR